MPFTIHEDDQVASKKFSKRLSEKNVENQKPLPLKSEIKIYEAKIDEKKVINNILKLICIYFYYLYFINYRYLFIRLNRMWN